MHRAIVVRMLRSLVPMSQRYSLSRKRRPTVERAQQALIGLAQLEPRVLLSATDVEPNDRVVTAGDFGNLTDVVIVNSVFGSISAFDTMDVYKFTVDRNRQADIQLHYLTGSVFLKLSKDNDGDQVLRSPEEIESSTVVSTDFSTLESLTPGTYFVTILRNNSDARTDYQLTVQVNDVPDSELTEPGTRTNTAADLGQLTETPVTRTEIVSAFDNDYYSFTLATASNVSLHISGVDEEINFILGQDLNNDNIVEVFEQTRILGSFQTLEALGPGKYYLTFASVNTTNANNDDNTDYQLELSASPLVGYSDAGATVGTATELVANTPALQDVITDGDLDLYRFTVGSPGQITVRLDGLTEAIQAILWQDTNGNGTLDSGEAIDTRSTSSATTFNRSLSVGTYYIQVTPDGSSINTAYQISLENRLPTNLALSSQTVSESAGVGTAVGTLSAVDPAGGATLTFFLVAGAGSTGNARFEIVGNELRTKTRLDFETGPVQSIRVQVTTASGESIEQVFSISVLDVPKSEDWVNVGNLNGGVAVRDAATGIGYLMYSEQNVRSRFGRSVETGNAEHFVAVQYSNGRWRFANDSGWVRFTPASSDRLVAKLDFSRDTAVLLTGQYGMLGGIQHGIAGSDLVITPNVWFGVSNRGEFGISGTYFVPGKDSTPLGLLNRGIASKDNATGVGYVMFSQAVVHQRFRGSVARGNADRLLAVQFINGFWFYANDDQWVNFVPEGTDRLLARLNFDTDTVELLAGQNTQVQGINAGFNNSDLAIQANVWGRGRNAGEFGVTGSYWN